MATVDFEILLAAHKEGLFVGAPTPRQRLYLRDQVITAWDIVWTVTQCDERGILISELSAKLNLRPKTIMTIVPWLKRKGLISYRQNRCKNFPARFYPKGSRLAPPLEPVIESNPIDPAIP
jgi:hypothetical protein